MERNSEINYLINHIVDSSINNIKYISANSSVDYIFESTKSIICPANLSSIPCSKIISNSLDFYNNVNFAGDKFIIMHSPPDIRTKKEDTFLFKQKISRMNLKYIFLDEYTRDMWQEPEAHLVPYGVPVSLVESYIEDLKIQQSKENNILILNFNRNKNIESLYHKMINDGIECHYIDKMPISIYNFIKKIATYKLIVNLENINIHNSLLCIICGCWVISPPVTNIIDLKSIFQVTSFAQIYTIINQMKDLDNRVLDADIEKIKSSFNEDAYLSKLEAI